MSKKLAIILLYTLTALHATVLAQQHQSGLIPLDKSYEPRKATPLSQYLDSMRLVYDRHYGVVVAEALNYLDNTQPQGTLANILTDALLQIGDSLSFAIDGRNADLALLNFGGIREPIPAGPITLGKIFSVMPFDNNNIVLLDVQGAELRKMFFHNLRQLKDIQAFGNVRLEYHDSILESATIGGEPIDDNRTYRLVTINFIENGGDKILEDVATKNILGESTPYRDRMIRYFRQKSKLHGVTDERVVISQ